MLRITALIIVLFSIVLPDNVYGYHHALEDLHHILSSKHHKLEFAKKLGAAILLAVKTKKFLLPIPLPLPVPIPIFKSYQPIIHDPLFFKYQALTHGLAAVKGGGFGGGFGGLGGFGGIGFG